MSALFRHRVSVTEYLTGNPAVQDWSFYNVNQRKKIKWLMGLCFGFWWKHLTTYHLLRPSDTDLGTHSAIAAHTRQATVFVKWLCCVLDHETGLDILEQNATESQNRILRTLRVHIQISWEPFLRQGNEVGISLTSLHSRNLSQLFPTSQSTDSAKGPQNDITPCLWLSECTGGCCMLSTQLFVMKPSIKFSW